ncbi:MAG: hypothetical protein D6710_04120 [Nitrospirae bacterium]|nr:MAG: hypothetical protein D6710_04120 [Nitrospirota bacterium]
MAKKESKPIVFQKKVSLSGNTYYVLSDPGDAEILEKDPLGKNPATIRLKDGTTFRLQTNGMLIGFNVQINGKTWSYPGSSLPLLDNENIKIA